MKLIFLIAVAFALSLLPLQISRAQDYSPLWEEFDARDLSYDEKRFLQSSLAFAGHYNGLLDGKWGGMSQEALERYAIETHGVKPARFHMATLAFEFSELLVRDGWNIVYAEPMGLSYLFPSKAAVAGSPSDLFTNWRHTHSSLGISFSIADKSTTEGFHQFTLDQHEFANAPYTVRKPNFAVSKSTKGDGSVIYTRSNFIGGTWSTIVISAARPDVNLLNAVASSISVGRTPELALPEYGPLGRSIALAVAFVEDENESQESSPKAPTQKGAATASQPSSSTGTSFLVSVDGYLLTNAHVVEGCENILVDGVPAKLVQNSELFDLALLHSPSLEAKAVAVFSPKPARLNSDVTVVGYPLSGLLAGLNVTRGAVSSTKGMAGDDTSMQISAPVQPGNSGGPVLLENGAVAGVVVSKLDAGKVQDAIGDIPQNVNFAVRGEIAQLFLFQNGIEPILAVNIDKLDPVDLAERASKFTKQVICD